MMIGLWGKGTDKLKTNLFETIYQVHGEYTL